MSISEYCGSGNITNNSLSLLFDGPENPSLVRVEYRKPSSTVLMERGYSSLNAAFSFQWTAAVQALCTLIVGEAVARMTSTGRYVLRGGKGSQALSLDNSISKKTEWLCDMFGCDSKGRPQLLHLIRRQNSGLKLPGDVAIALKEFAFSGGISVFFLEQDNPLHVAELRSLLATLETLRPSQARRIGSQSSRRRSVLDGTVQTLGYEKSIEDYFLFCASNQLIADFAVFSQINPRTPLQNYNKCSVSQVTKQKSLLRSRGTSLEATFAELGYLENFFLSAHENFLKFHTNDDTIVGQVAHLWWPLRFSEGDFEKMIRTEYKSGLSFILSGRSVVDDWVAKFYTSLGASNAQSSACSSHCDTWVYGDLLVKVFMPHEAILNIEREFHSAASLLDLDRERLFSKLKGMTGPFTLSIVYNPTEAANLRSFVGRTVC